MFKQAEKEIITFQPVFGWFCECLQTKETHFLPHYTVVWTQSRTMCRGAMHYNMIFVQLIWLYFINNMQFQKEVNLLLENWWALRRALAFKSLWLTSGWNHVFCLFWNSTLPWEEVKYVAMYSWSWFARVLADLHQSPASTCQVSWIMSPVPLMHTSMLIRSIRPTSLGNVQLLYGQELLLSLHDLYL